MTKFIELTKTSNGEKILLSVDSIVTVTRDEERKEETVIVTVDHDYYFVFETYEEIKELIVEAENKQNSIANAILEVDQTLYHRLR